MFAQGVSLPFDPFDLLHPVVRSGQGGQKVVEHPVNSSGDKKRSDNILNIKKLLISITYNNLSW